MSNDPLSRLQSAKTDEEREWIILEFSLQNLEQELQDAIWAAAIPHWFDVKFLAALLGKPIKQIKKIYNQLRNLSYVEDFVGRGLNIHERTRRLTLNHLWRENNKRFCELSRRAALHAKNRDKRDSSWKIERIYHLLISKPDEGIQEMYKVCSEWNKAPVYAFDKIDATVRIVSEHADSGRLSNRGMAWLNFWSATLDYNYSRYNDAKITLLKLKSSDGLENQISAEINFKLGRISLITGDYEEAKENFEKALIVFRQMRNKLGEAKSIKSIGDAFRLLSEDDKARQHYEMAMLKYQDIGDQVGEANSLTAIGRMYHFESKPKLAFERYKKALHIYEKLGDRLGEANCLKIFGDYYMRLGKFNKARGFHRRALPILRQFGDRVGEAECIMGMGFTDKIDNLHDSAKKLFLIASKIFQEIGHELGVANCMLYLGDIAASKRKWSEAEKRYKWALAFFLDTKMQHSIGSTYRRLGYMEWLRSKNKSAAEYYKKALESFHHAGSPLAKEVKRDLNLLPFSFPPKPTRIRKKVNQAKRRVRKSK